MARAHAVSTALVVAGLALGGCLHLVPDVTTHRPARALQAGPGHAMLVIIQPTNSGVSWVIFTADGAPRCEVPPTHYCVMALAPGHHRLYASPSALMDADALDLDVAAGRRYIATVSSSWGMRIEQLTANSPADRLSALGEWLARDEAVLDEAGVETLRQELARHPGLIENAEQRWGRYDAVHIEVHTLTADEAL